MDEGMALPGFLGISPSRSWMQHLHFLTPSAPGLALSGCRNSRPNPSSLGHEQEGRQRRKPSSHPIWEAGKLAHAAAEKPQNHETGNHET